MNISQVARLTELSVKSIRLYEDKQLIFSPIRSANGYRVYNENHVKELSIVSRARGAGFSLEECKALVELARNPCRKSSEVKGKAQKKLDEVNQKIADLVEIKRTLESWIQECPGDVNSKCPIIEALIEER